MKKVSLVIFSLFFYQSCQDPIDVIRDVIRGEGTNEATSATINFSGARNFFTAAKNSPTAQGYTVYLKAESTADTASDQLRIVSMPLVNAENPHPDLGETITLPYEVSYQIPTIQTEKGEYNWKFQIVPTAFLKDVVMTVELVDRSSGEAIQNIVEDASKKKGKVFLDLSDL